jgi:uncharacterized protein YraI
MRTEALSRANPAMNAAAAATPPDPPNEVSGAPPALGTVRVANTDGQGVSLRAQPSTRAARLALIREGSTLEVIGPDQQAEGRTWRNVRQPGGQSGWVAADYLAQ